MKQLNRQDIASIVHDARLARQAILKMTTLASSGHPGGSMSTIDLMLTLYRMINVYPADPLRDDRDMVVVSNGHVSPCVYSALALTGFFPLDEAISGYRRAGSAFEGHIEPDVPGVEWASGILGQGLSAACGFALGAGLKNQRKNVFCFMGDGEQQKGQISEARRFAVKFGLCNITAIIDYNRLQIGGAIDEVMPHNIAADWVADGWNVLEIDGHDIEEIHQALHKASDVERPVMILAHTVMGKGVSFMENQAKYHGSTLPEDKLGEALAELDGQNDLDRYRKLRQTHNFPALHRPAPSFDVPHGKPRVYEQKTDNRSAWGNALNDLAAASPELFAVFDCDLIGSVKVNGFAEQHPTHFFETGIMEHHAAVCSGALSTQGFQVFFAAFGVFGIDETYNQHRLNDINRANLKIVTTHVGLDVGEDGKTHQCVDYLGLVRNLFGFGVIVPADPNQTDRAIRWLAAQPGNWLVAMGRSKLQPLRHRDGSLFYDADYRFSYGQANRLRDGDKAAILVMGTPAGNAVAAADKLFDEGVAVQVWNIASPLRIDEAALRAAAATGVIVTVEDHSKFTGLGSLVAERLVELGLHCRLVRVGVSDYAISGPAGDVYHHCGLDTASIVTIIKDNT
ncbi:MAG: transketolase [Candidatus Cloacimonetes bacterium]|nr:transketolase [Candidatus Cloacimonadota bacterium]